jgi:hypothetical protein
MSDDNARLVGLARSISDGVGVDWEKASGEAASADETARIQELKQIEGVVAAHRALHSLPPEGPAPPLSFWGPLALIETIGRGAFGEVFLARDPHLDRHVALKLLHADTPGRASIADAVIEEGRLMARVRHPNVVTIYGAERHDGRVGMWMELIEGQPLSKILEERGVLGAREAGLIGLDLCRALAAVHHAGLVHQDMKAQNVMREHGGRIVLMDFSAGRDTRGGASPLGVESGTPLYMPPEVFRGERPDHRGDIYSLGVLLFHLVTGSFPVVAETVDGLRQAHLRGETQALAGLRPDLPPAFVRVVEHALAPEPEARFGSAASMEQALSVALGIEGRDATRDVPAKAVARPRSRFTVPALVIALGLAIVAVSWLTSTRGRPGTATGAATNVPPPPMTIHPDGSYTVEASFYRGTTARERLAPDGRVAVGDALALEFRASRSLYVYVVNEDDNGEAVLLFPLAGGEATNPLPANTSHLLPGALEGKQNYWQVTSSGGREHFLMIASPKRLTEFEAETVGLIRPQTGRPLQYAPLTPEAKEHLRGVAGLVTGPRLPQSGSRSHLFDLAETLASRSEVIQGTWVRRLDLDNPIR